MQPNTMFRKGMMQLHCRKTFVDKVHDKDNNTRIKQYCALYAGDRLLSTGDFLEEDALIICSLFNESVARRKLHGVKAT